MKYNHIVVDAITKIYITEKEYLENERKALLKSEYYNGEVFAMAGVSSRHYAITAAIIGELYSFFKGKTCRVFPSDLRVHNNLNTLYTYPDVTIVCGKEEYLDDEFDTLLNPTVLIECFPLPRPLMTEGINLCFTGVFHH